MTKKNHLTATITVVYSGWEIKLSDGRAWFTKFEPSTVGLIKRHYPAQAGDLASVGDQTTITDYQGIFARGGKR